MKPYNATAPAILAPSAGAVLAADFRRVLASSAGLGAGVLLVVCVVAIAVRDWSWSWCIWPLIAAALPPLVWAVGNLVELVRDMAERVTRIDLNGDGVIGAPEPTGEPFRLILAKAPAARQAEQDTDRHWVIHRAYAVGLAFRQWKGVTLPSGRRIDEAFWSTFLAQLTDAGMIEPGRPGQSARWLTDEATVLSRFV